MDASGAASPSRTRRHLAYAVVITIISIFAAYGGVLPIFRSHLMQYLSIGDDRFGLLFSVGSITGLVSVLFGGYLIDRWGPRRIIRICLVGVGISMFAVGLSGRSYPLIVISVGLVGVFTAPLFIAISAYVAKLFPKRQRRMISLNLASTSLGGMMFPIVAEGLLYLASKSDAVSFGHILHLPFMLVGTMLIGASLIYRKRPASGSNGPAAPLWRESLRWRRRDLLLPPRALVLGILIALHGMADSVIHIWMPRFLESGSFRETPAAPGIIMSGYALAYLLSRSTLATIPDRIGRRAFLVLPGILGGAIMVAGILSRSFILTSGGYILGAFCWSIEYPSMVSALIRNDRKRFGAAMATSGLITGILMFASINIMGIVIQRIGEEQMWKVMLAPSLTFVLIGVGGFAWLKLFGRERAETQASSP